MDEHWNVYMEKAHLCIKARQYVDAEKYFHKVVKSRIPEIIKSPILAEAWCGKGQAYVGLEQYDEAKKCFDKSTIYDYHGDFEQIVKLNMMMHGDKMKKRSFWSFRK